MNPIALKFIQAAQSLGEAPKIDGNHIYFKDVSFQVFPDFSTSVPERYELLWPATVSFHTLAVLLFEKVLDGQGDFETFLASAKPHLSNGGYGQTINGWTVNVSKLNDVCSMVFIKSYITLPLPKGLPHGLRGFPRFEQGG